MTGLLFANEQMPATPQHAPAADASADPDRPETSTNTECLPDDGPLFARGTRIATPAGGVPIENLKAGDLVSTMTGSARPIRRIASLQIDLTRHPAAERVRPICLRARAFANQIPIRDTFVSPNLGVWREGRIVPVHRLVNGSSVVRDTRCPSVTYFHMVLDTNGIVFAEGLPTASHRDADQDSVTVAIPEHTIADAQSPATTAGADMYVALDGEKSRPVFVRDRRYTFVLSGARDDLRILTRGRVAIRGIAFRQGSDIVPIPMDHPLLTDGWSAWERDERSIWRWTDSDALLVSPVDGNAILEIDVR